MEEKDLKYWEEGLGLGWKSTFKEETGIDPDYFEGKFKNAVQEMTDEERVEWIDNVFKIK